MANLTTDARDKLSSSEFAVPHKRKLPIHDATHVKLAWSSVSRTQGLTSEERATARRRILRKAKALGLNIEGWQKLAAVDLGIEAFEVEDESELENPLGEPLQTSNGVPALRFEAAALSLPDDSDHPNRLAFSGTLTKVGIQSDGAPNGSGGRRVIVSKKAAEAALDSLLAMGVNSTPDLSGHNPKNKIGVITAAHIDGEDLRISGHLYKGDFPEEIRVIQAQKDRLGFSFEADSIWVEDAHASPLTLTSLKFTGASILLKAKAAYRSTSLAASTAANQDFEMTKEELAALLGEQLKPLVDRIEKIEAGSTVKTGKVEANAEIQAAVEPHAARLENAAYAIHHDGLGGGALGATAYILGIGADLRKQAAEGTIPMIHRDHDWPLHASRSDVPLPTHLQANLTAMVEPHAQELEETADAMEKAGIGKHPHDGHAAHARHVAHMMRAHAARGKVAHFGRMSASAALVRAASTTALAQDADALKKAIEAATTPLIEKINTLETQVKDTKAKAFQASTQPERKTISGPLQVLLQRTGIQAPEDGKVLTDDQFNKLLADGGVTDPNKRIAMKISAARAGILPPAAGTRQ